MKISRCFLTILLVTCTMRVHAQTWDEWFKQKKTQTKYLVEQIAALQVYLDFLEKGYHITKNGLHLISDIKNGEFSLHKHYFNSLKTVNPNIMRYPKIAAILSMQMGIVNQHYQVLSLSKASGQLQTNEINYIRKVYENLEDEADKDLEELQLVITDGQMQMTDDERISKIDKIYKQVQDKYSFSKNFSDKVRMLNRQRKQDQREAEDLKQLYGKTQ